MSIGPYVAQTPIFISTQRIRTMTGLQRVSDIAEQDIADACARAEAEMWMAGGGSVSKNVVDDGSVVPSVGSGRNQFISACEYQACVEVMTTWVTAPNYQKIEQFRKLAQDKIFLFRQSVAAFMPGLASGSRD